MASKVKEYYAEVKSDENGTFLSIPIVSKGKDYEVIIDAVDFKRFEQYNWTVLYRRGVATYLKRRILKAEGGKEGKERVEMLHHFVLRLGSEIHLDHIDGNGFNCRSCNLRVATVSQNAQNSKSRKNTISKYKGVGLCKGGKAWTAKIGYEGKLHHLGTYAKEIINGIDEGEKRAARKYDEQAILIFGSFARLNLPDERNMVKLKDGEYKRTYLMNEQETKNLESEIKVMATWTRDEIDEDLGNKSIDELLGLCHYYGCGVAELTGEIRKGLLIAGAKK